MSFHKSIAISAVFLSAIFLVVVNCKEIIANRETREPTYLGNVGNKQFFVMDQLDHWESAQYSCRSIGMSLVTLNSTEEYEFTRDQLMVADKGPFWLGGRSIGNLATYQWSVNNGSPNLNDPPIGDFVPFYFFVEKGLMALQMNKAVGPSVFGAHSYTVSAKALCQTL